MVVFNADGRVLPSMHTLSRLKRLMTSRRWTIRYCAYIVALQASLWRLKVVATETDTCSAEISDTCLGEPQRDTTLGYVTPW